MVTTTMPTWYRRGLFAVLATSLLTGLTFFTLNTWVTVEGDFGPEKHPWQYTSLKIHAAAAFLAMMYFGSLLLTHVPLSWRTGRLRTLGMSLTFSIGFQVISAWLLYYLSNEYVRQVFVYAHLGIGFLIPCLLGVHIWKGLVRRRSVVYQT